MIDIIFQSMNDIANEKGYLSSAYKIGSLILASKDIELNALKETLTPSQIEKLWAAITHLDPSQRAIDPNRSRLEACQNWIASDIDLLQSIGQTALIKLGQENEQYARKVLIVLIRSHNQKAFIGFNEQGLSAGSVEQTCQSIVWPTIRKCEHLPIDLIKKLGTHPKIARNILLDIEPHPQAKVLSDYFHKQHHWPQKTIEEINVVSPKTIKTESPPFLSFAYAKLKLRRLINRIREIIQSILVSRPPNPILTWYDHYCARHRSQPCSELNARTIKRHP